MTIKDTLAAIEARHDKLVTIIERDAMLIYSQTEKDRAELLRICKAQQAVVDAGEKLVNTGTHLLDHHRDARQAFNDALTALREIEQ